MTVREFAEKINGKVITALNKQDLKIEGMYVCDLLSWAMSHAKKGDAWITVLTNKNILAVAVMTEVACVIIPENVQVEGVIMEKAEEEGVAIMLTPLTAYETCKRASGII